MSDTCETALDAYAVEPMAVTRKHLGGICMNSIRKLAKAGELEIVTILDRRMVVVESRRRLVAKGIGKQAVVRGKAGAIAGNNSAASGA